MARGGGHFESLLCINIIFFNIFFNRNFWYMLSLRQYQTGICVVLKQCYRGYYASYGSISPLPLNKLRDKVNLAQRNFFRLVSGHIIMGEIS